MKKRIICALLALSFAFAGLIACGNGPKEETTTPQATTTAPTVTDAPVVTTTEYVEALEVPENYFLNGYEFNILFTALMNSPPNPFTAKDTALVLDEAVYRRNALIEDTYGVIINPIEYFGSSADGKAVILLAANRNSGDTLYDAGLIDAYAVAQLAQNAYLSDLKQLPYLDLEKSWWDQNATANTTIFGKTYFTTGDITHNDKEYTFATFFNKTMAKELELGDLYALVREGKWTLDKLSDMAKLVSEDLNGDDVLDTRDRFGLITWDAMLSAAIHGSGNAIAKIENDELILTLNNEEVISVVEKYVGLCQDPCVTNFQHMKAGGVNWDEIFYSGNSLFLHEYLKALPMFRDTELDYGILPMPKLSEEQDNYYNGVAVTQVSMYCIPADVHDEEISGIISEAMAYHGKEIVTPAYYDRTLIGRHVQDKESAETLEIIFDNRIYDLGLFYEVGGLRLQINALIGNKSTEFSSMYAKFEKAALADLKRINNFYASNED